MITATAADIIDRAVSLEEGEDIVIPYSSYNELETMRIQLYKRRATLEKKHEAQADSIYISREVNRKEGTFLLLVKKAARCTGLFIRDKDGNIKPFLLPEREAFVPGSNSPVRTVMQMREDGWTDTRIEKYFRKEGLSDEEIKRLLGNNSQARREIPFDEAAAIIEKSQGIVAEDEVPENPTSEDDTSDEVDPVKMIKDYRKDGYSDDQIKEAMGKDYNSELIEQLLGNRQKGQ